MIYIPDETKAILFDHDDTLVATIEAKWAQHKQMARKYYNKELLDDEIREHWGKPLRTLVQILFETNDVDTAIEREKEFYKEFPKRLFDDTLGVVERLREKGKLVGVITAHSRMGYEYDIDDLGIPRALFDYTQTSDDTPFHKPDPRVFEPAKAWLKEHQVQSSEVIYIGDGLHDMQAALAANFGFVGITTGLVSKEEFQREGAKSVSRLTELLDS